MNKLKLLKSDEDGLCLTIEINDEDHTLGNSLRHIILKNENVKFCGYSLPHPNERKVLLQIQTHANKGTALEAFEKGLSDLIDVCNIVTFAFQTSFPS